MKTQDHRDSAGVTANADVPALLTQTSRNSSSTTKVVGSQDHSFKTGLVRCVSFRCVLSRVVVGGEEKRRPLFSGVSRWCLFSIECYSFGRATRLV